MLHSFTENIPPSALQNAPTHTIDFTIFARSRPSQLLPVSNFMHAWRHFFHVWPSKHLFSNIKKDWRGEGDRTAAHQRSICLHLKRSETAMQKILSCHTSAVQPDCLPAEMGLKGTSLFHYREALGPRRAAASEPTLSLTFPADLEIKNSAQAAPSFREIWPTLMLFVCLFVCLLSRLISEVSCFGFSEFSPASCLVVN